MMVYHQPVLLQECIEGLNIDPTGTYVDVTFGGGGHSREILNRLTTGKLIAFDRDPAAGAERLRDERLLLLHQNFRYLKNNIRYHRALPANGVLADIGVSSYQIDGASRGFSFRFDGALDMRMSPGMELTAGKVVNEYSEKELERVFREYGELKNARKLSITVVASRKESRIETTMQLKRVIAPCVPRNRENQYCAKIFQALRIEVNDELGALRDMLQQTEEVICKGGRLVVISYHSLEDRLVKNYMRSGNFESEMVKDFYGNIQRPFNPINRKVIVPGQDEIANNNRARSARLRIAERV